jgi:hypothetical protein
MAKNCGLFFFILAFMVSCPDPSGSDGEIRVEIPEDLLGMVHAGNRSEVDREYDLLDDLGVHWMLTDFSWSSIEPAENTQNLDAFKTYADNGKKKGKKILAILDYDVGWIHNGKYDDDKFTDGQRHNYISPKEIPLFCKYVKKTVFYYKDQVDAWCIWNEPNLADRFWRGTPEEFFALTKAAAATIREVVPDAFIVGGAFNTLASEEWVRGIFTSGAMDQIDAIAYHPYLVSARTSAAAYTKFKNIVSDYGFGGKIWVTEVGYPTQGSYGTEVSDERMPVTLIETISRLAVEGANHVFWYHLFDPEIQDDRDSEDWFGVMNYDFTPKKGAAAYALCGAHLPGKTWHSSLPERSGLPEYIVANYFEGPNGDNTLVIWNDRPSISLDIKVRLPGDNRKSYDVASGDFSIPDEETIISFSLTKTLYFFTWENSGTSQPPRISAP